MNNIFKNLSQQELFNVLICYDNYIFNEGEMWNEDRQPVCISEFYENEYQDEDYGYKKLLSIKVGDIITKQIEEGHCIIKYQLKVDEIEFYKSGYMVFLGNPITEEDEEYAVEYGYNAGAEEIII